MSINDTHFSVRLRSRSWAPLYHPACPLLLLWTSSYVLACRQLHALELMRNKEDSGGAIPTHQSHLLLGWPPGARERRHKGPRSPCEYSLGVSAPIECDWPVSGRATAAQASAHCWVRPRGVCRSRSRRRTPRTRALTGVQTMRTVGHRVMLNSVAGRRQTVVVALQRRLTILASPHLASFALSSRRYGSAPRVRSWSHRGLDVRCGLGVC